MTGAEEIHNCFFYARLSLIKPVGGKGADKRVNRREMQELR